LAPRTRASYNSPVTRAEELHRTVSRRISPELVILGLYLAISVPLAYALNLWQDEAYTLHTTGAGLAYAFRAAIGFEQNAPLYFLIVSLLRHFGDGVFFLRLFSVLCIAATIALVPLLSRRYLPQSNASFVTAVVAFNPFVIYAAIDLRAYGLIILLSALLLLICYDAFLADSPSAGAAVVYAVCVAAALYTQYYLAFLIAAQGFAVLLYRRRAFWRILLAGFAGALAFAPMLVIVPQQVQNFRQGFATPSLAHSFAGLGLILLRYVAPLPLPHAKFVYAGLAAVALLAFALARPSLKSSGSMAIVVMTGCAAILFAVAAYEGGVHILDRHAASLYLPATLSVFALIASLPAEHRQRAALGWCAAVVLLSLATLGRTYASGANDGDWIRVTRYLQANERAGEPIAMFEAENALPLAYYYRGPNRIVPIPQAVDFSHYDVAAFVVRNNAQLEAAFPRGIRLWLVTAGGCASASIEFGCPTLEGFIRERYNVQSDTAFHGSRVRLLVPKAPLTTR
jgi:Dolichyl-phosphate-mannose-protein mannosyltransferase